MMKRKTPFGWDAREIVKAMAVVRKLLLRTRGVRYGAPAPALIQWHTSKYGPYFYGPSYFYSRSSSAVWLTREANIAEHAIAFAKGFVRPAPLKQSEVVAIRAHYAPSAFFVRMKAKSPKKPKLDKRMKAAADVRRWTAEVVKRQRAVKAAQKKLMSAQRSERALERAAAARAALPVEKVDDDALREKLRAMRSKETAT